MRPMLRSQTLEKGEMYVSNYSRVTKLNLIKFYDMINVQSITDWVMTLP